MPFFARLYAEKKMDELGGLVVKSARASSAIAALCGAGMIALAAPLVDLLFRRGAFTVDKVMPTAIYLQLFSIAIPLWGMQGIVARAFYAAGDTLTPMLAGTLVTVASVPIYWALFHALGPNGLVIASGIGILLHTTVLLVLLPRRVVCDRAGLIAGVARAMLLGAIAGAPAWAAARWLPFGRLHGHGASLAQTAVGGLVFAIVVMLLMKPLHVDDVATLFNRLMARLTRRRVSRG
jgi:putative peptidoglycan lipid II flippase